MGFAEFIIEPRVARTRWLYHPTLAMPAACRRGIRAQSPSRRSVCTVISAGQFSRTGARLVPAPVDV